MKKTLTFATMALFCISVHGQNTFPATGNVGIGNSTPSYLLDVTTNSSTGSTNTAFIGNKWTSGSVTYRSGLRISNTYNTSSNSGTTKLWQFSGLPSNHGFIEFGTAATTNTTIAAVSFGYSSTEFMRINTNGKIRIGSGASDIKTPDGYRLFVEQGILTEKVKVAVKTSADWADYVFAPDYKLMPLNEVETFIKENQHLPNVPSAQQMVENGLDVAKTDAMLMQKVEELTLYIIDQQKLIAEQQKQIEALAKRLDNLESQK